MKSPSDYLPAPEEIATPPALAIISVDQLVKMDLAEPAELVRGILHGGSKLVIGSNSKGCKTWTLLDLALSVASGEPWLSFKTTKGRVLFLNFEVQSVFFRKRIQAVAEEKRISLDGLALDLLNLRGLVSNPQALLVTLAEQIKDKGYALIILDPIYKIYSGTDENAAGDVARLLNQIEALATSTDAAVVFSAHFSKGNQAGKESIDRISGSGVFARDPDSILILTKLEEENAFAVESTLRNFKPLEPFAVRWQWPLMRRDDDLDPSKLKQPGNKGRKYSEQQLIAVLGKRKLTTGEWCKLVETETGMSRRTFYDLHKLAIKSPNIKQNPKDQWFTTDKCK